MCCHVASRTSLNIRTCTKPHARTHTSLTHAHAPASLHLLMPTLFSGSSTSDNARGPLPLLGGGKHVVQEVVCTRVLGVVYATAGLQPA